MVAGLRPFQLLKVMFAVIKQALSTIAGHHKANLYSLASTIHCMPLVTAQSAAEAVDRPRLVAAQIAAEAVV